jgi:hypothetical protein
MSDDQSRDREGAVPESSRKGTKVAKDAPSGSAGDARDAAFTEAAEHVLRKNRELYKRLADDVAASETLDVDRREAEG